MHRYPVARPFAMLITRFLARAQLLKKREHHPGKPSVRTAQQQAISRLAHSKDFTAGMTFLTQKPDLL